MNQQHRKPTRTNWLMPLLLIGGLAGGWVLWKTGPRTQPEEKKRAPKKVRTIHPRPETRRVSLTAYGEVIPARRVVMEPEVRGRIVRHHPLLIPGGQIPAGEELFGIEDTLGRLDLRGAIAAVKRAEADLLETRRKYTEAKRLADELITSQTELAAREAEVALEMAELDQLIAARDRAQEMLTRYSVPAPFNALVVEEAVEIGQQVAPGFAAATLVGTDEFWVRVALPVGQLEWVHLPREDQPGAQVRVFLETGNQPAAERGGQVIRLLGDMERTGRMARVLVSVADPLGLKPAQKTTPFLLGSYVRVEIDAGELTDVLTIERAALRDGDSIWVADANGELQIRPANVRWQQGDTIYIDNALQTGDALIISPLRVALPGMKVEAQAVGGGQ